MPDDRDYGADVHILLRREGWEINHKRVYRIYKEEGLNLRYKSRRKKASIPRVPEKNVPSRLNECWAMDFVSDQLYDGKRFRALTIIDTYSRECLSIYGDKAIKGETVVDVLNGVHLDYSRPGKPTDNAHIESFDGSFRDECLNINWFMSLEDAKEKINRWKNDYNDFRLHSGLTHMTPSEFASAARAEAV